MPPRPKRDKRSNATRVSPEAVAIFRQGIDMLRGPHDRAELRDLKITLAAALGRSKFAANPLDPNPRSLIGCDREPPEFVLDIQRLLLRAIGERAMPV
ncbi:hypothetical protein BjapCC829_23075 [Bradyrhizobium barranii]|uniref:Uncharacterized protein n=1 Tax=Bradyrhizobium barranii TaxID=2992140 RepID=A0ABY3QAG0_9BRAD|nr:hypothetical protein [Bradyrhizobium japonicum]UFW82874.1 hypothetical protein BjapCC829_23075 [Bradyrhizobium japonicum]